MPTEQFPALARLTDDLAHAMHQAEQRPRRPRGMRRTTLLAALALSAAVPTAVAVHLATRTEVTLRPPGRAPQSAFVVAHGRQAGLFWTLAVTRCELDGVVTLIPATSIETTPGTGGGGFSRCPRGLSGEPSRRQALLAPTFQSQPGRLAIHWGIVPARVASVELRFGSGLLPARVATRLLDPAGVRAGRLPAGYRLFVVLSRRDTIYTRAIARDAAGRVLRRCTRRQCDSLARRGR